MLSDFRERRAELGQHPEIVSDVLEKGRERADAVFSETVATVRERMGITNF